MKRGGFGYSALVGLGVVIFVALVGALGYTYVMNYKSEVASAPKSTQTTAIAAETIKAPEVASTTDLDAAASTLDDASVDLLSDDDMASLEAELDSL